LENPDFIDHRAAGARQFIDQHSTLFEHQGSVVESWRWRRGRRRGPYYRLAYHDELGRQRSVYLGADAGLASAVRQALVELHAPQRERHWIKELRRDLRRGLRHARVAMDVELQALGLYCKGAEIRGWRTSQLSCQSTVD